MTTQLRVQPHEHHVPVPRGALLGAGALVLVSIALAGAARDARIAEAEHAAAPAPALASIDVRFEDRVGGALAVLDAESGSEISAVAPGTNGFVRGVLRGMFRTRKLEALSRHAVFRLAREANGRLSLTDRESGRRIDLDSFGPTNSESFATVLDAGIRARGAGPTAAVEPGHQGTSP
jgi:putative photosynthetic complex assembly protein